jgi:hypothetical protein
MMDPTKKKRCKRIIWRIVLSIFFCLYIAYQINMAIPRTSAEMKNAAYHNIWKALEALNMKDLPFTRPKLVKAYSAAEERFYDYEMYTMLDNDTLVVRSTVPENKRLAVSAYLVPKDSSKRYLLGDHRLYDPKRTYQIFVNNSDDSVYVAAYYYDITKNPHKAARKNPAEDAYKWVPPHDTNEHCVNMYTLIEDAYLADSTMDAYEKIHVFVYDPKIFKQYTWQEIKEKNMFLKHIQCLPPKYLDPPTVFEYP